MAFGSSPFGKLPFGGTFVETTTNTSEGEGVGYSFSQTSVGAYIETAVSGQNNVLAIAEGCWFYSHTGAGESCARTESTTNSNSFVIGDGIGFAQAISTIVVAAFSYDGDGFSVVLANSLAVGDSPSGRVFGPALQSG